MRGVGSACAAVSIVNGLPLGIGAAVGIDWPARASVSPMPPTARAGAIRVEPASSSTPLVREAVRLARQRFAGGTALRMRVVVRSTIPRARGLKSSSAVGSSVVSAVARACGAEPAPQEVARSVADVGRRTGVSATGAFDDALAGLVTGGVVTDNRRDRPLRRIAIDRTLRVALWIPHRSHPRSPSVVRRFRRDPMLAERAVDAVLDGEWTRAMDANTALVEAALGYRYASLRERLKDAGAVAVGVSGLGPTLAAFVPGPRAERALHRFPRSGARRLVRLASRASRSEASR